LKSVSRRYRDGKKTALGYQDISGRVFFVIEVSLLGICRTLFRRAILLTQERAIVLLLSLRVLWSEKGEHVPFLQTFDGDNKGARVRYRMVQQSQQDQWKQLAGTTAATLIEDGMVVGLGTGSTAAYLVKALAERMRAGLRIVGAISSSIATRDLAASLDIPLTTLDDHPQIDIYIDGADEIDPQLNLIKGAGGALLREKILASCSQRFVVVADHTKRVDQLGRGPLPVEVIPLAVTPVARRLSELGAQPRLRQVAGKTFVTDNSNVILDCTFAQGINDAAVLNESLHKIVGVVEDGLFIGMTHQAIIGGPDGVTTLAV
jgi:ribose 5-phosphate isomerase A